MPKNNLNKKNFRLGTRKSALALIQANQIKTELEAQGIGVELVEITSLGDENQTSPLYAIETQTPGLFTKQLETALLQGEIDFAVHSLKDVPTTQPKGLKIAAISRREDPSELLIVQKSFFKPQKNPLLPLQDGCIVGTSSLRREAQLLALSPNLHVTPIRGNISTRITKLETGAVNAIVLAQAGVQRLKLSFADKKDLVTFSLQAQNFVPAPGQGALAIEVTEWAAKELLEGLEKIHDPQSAMHTGIERKILHSLQGGCSLPLGVLSTSIAQGEKIQVQVFLGKYKDKNSSPKEWIGFTKTIVEETNADNAVQKVLEHLSYA